MKVFTIILVLLTVLPIKTNALNKIRISINSNIEIIDNTRRCSHEIHNIKDYVMCLLETDIYDIHKEELDNRLSDPGEEARLLPDDIEEAKTFMADYDELISNFNWNYNPYYDSEPNSSNFGNFQDGIYIKNRVYMLLDDQETNEDFSNYFDYLVNDLGYLYRNSTYQFSNKLKRSLGINLFQNIKPNSRIRNVGPTESGSYRKTTFKAIGEQSDTNIMNVVFPMSSDIVTFNNNGQKELENAQFNGSIYVKIQKLNDGFIAKDYDINPEIYSLTLLNRRSSLINNLIDLYIRHERMILKDAGYFEQLAGYTRDLLYFYTTSKRFMFNDSIENIVSGNISDRKTKEFIKWFDNVNITSFYPYYDRYCNDSDENEVIRQYYEDNNLNYKVETYNNVDYLVLDENIIDVFKIIYNGKYYEKTEGFLEFIKDYYNISTEGFPNNEQAVLNYIWENNKN